MLSRSRLVFIFLSLLTVSLLLVGGSLASTAGRQGDDGEDSLYKYLSLFAEVLGLVDRAYVDETEMELLMAGAFEGTVEALDPFSLYVPSSQVDGFQEIHRIGAGRSGLLVLKERGTAYAMTVVEGSPAERAGIERGDVISMIEGESTRQMPLFHIHSVLAGPVGTKVKIESIHRGIKQDVELELEDYARPGVELEAKNGAAVLRIAAFDDKTALNVSVSLDALKSTSSLPGLTDKDKLLIDLRGIAGGNPEAAFDVAALFTTGELGALKVRDDVERTFADETEPRFTGSVVVLIDRGTQGPAEVLAKVLQQNLEATLVGTYSFGYSGRLAPVKLSNGGHLLLTDAFYTGPDKEPISSGIEPDVLVRPEIRFSGGGGDDEEDEEEPPDVILERGLSVLLGEEEVEKKRAA